MNVKNKTMSVEHIAVFNDENQLSLSQVYIWQLRLFNLKNPIFSVVTKGMKDII